MPVGEHHKGTQRTSSLLHASSCPCPRQRNPPCDAGDGEQREFVGHTMVVILAVEDARPREMETSCVGFLEVD